MGRCQSALSWYVLQIGISVVFPAVRSTACSCQLPTSSLLSSLSVENFADFNPFFYLPGEILPGIWVFGILNLRTYIRGFQENQYRGAVFHSVPSRVILFLFFLEPKQGTEKRRGEEGNLRKEISFHLPPFSSPTSKVSLLAAAAGWDELAELINSQCSKENQTSNLYLVIAADAIAGFIRT